MPTMSIGFIVIRLNYYNFTKLIISKMINNKLDFYMIK